ncbi:hypothetical protein K8I61_02200 [bacterium]|nr:hypothetical protein [bacterium]
MNPRVKRGLDAAIAVLAVACVFVTYRAFQPRKAAPPSAIESPSAAPAAGETPMPGEMPVAAASDAPDPNPERTLMLRMREFFESIAKGRAGDAAVLFLDPQKRASWKENLERVEKRGNPIAAYDIPHLFEAPYCAVEAADRGKGRCRFPILIYRRENDVVEWAIIATRMMRKDGEWWIDEYEQERIDEAAFTRAAKAAGQGKEPPEPESGEASAPGSG